MEQDLKTCSKICKDRQSKNVETFSIQHGETKSQQYSTLGNMDRGTSTERQNVTSKGFQDIGERSQCLQCNTIIQQVAGLLSEIKHLRSNAAKGSCVCEYFSLRNISGKCKRCYILLQQFLTEKAYLYELRQQQYTEWLFKVKHILQSVFEPKATACHHKDHQRYGTSNKELDDLLKQLKGPLSNRELQVGRIPSVNTVGAFETTDILDESADILENLLEKLKYENEIKEKQNIESSYLRSSSVTSLPQLTTKFKVLPPKIFKSSPNLPPTDKMIESLSISEKGGKQSRYSAEKNAVKLKQDKTRSQSLPKMQNLKQKQPVGIGSSTQTGAMIKKRPRSLSVIKEDVEDRGKKNKSKELLRKKDQSSKIASPSLAVTEKLGKYKKDLDLDVSDKIRDKKGQSTKKIKPVKGKSSDNKQPDAGIVTPKSRKEFETKTTVQKKEVVGVKKDRNKTEATKEKELLKTEEKIPSQTEEKGTKEKNKNKAALTKRQRETRVNADDELQEGIKKKGKTKAVHTKRQPEKKVKTDDELQQDMDEITLEKALKANMKVEKEKKKKLRKELILAREKQKLTDLLDKEKRKLFEKKIQEIKEAMLTTKPQETELPKSQLEDEFEIVEIADRKASGDAIVGTKMIKGKDIVDCPFNYNKKQTSTKEPLFPQISHMFDSKEIEIIPQESQEEPTQKDIGVSVPGRFMYKLSNREFIQNGVTQLPEITVTRRMHVFKMVPSGHGNWFENNKESKVLFYDTGELLAEIDDEGFGKLYYKNGLLALDYYKATELYAEERYVVYSSGESDENGNPRPITVLASFDRMGNGIVYDHFGNIRLKYNQSEGEVIDPKIGAPGRWKWHGLNDGIPVSTTCRDPCLTKFDHDPRLDDIIAESKITKQKHTLSHGDKIDKRLIQTELDNFAKMVSKIAQRKLKNFDIKTKVLKLNEQFSLHILNQQNIYLRFIDGLISFKVNLGMQLINNEVVDIEPMLLHEVSTPYELPFPRSESMENIKEIIAAAKKKSVETREDRFLRKPRRSSIVHK